MIEVRTLKFVFTRKMGVRGLLGVAALIAAVLTNRSGVLAACNITNNAQGNTGYYSNGYYWLGAQQDLPSGSTLWPQQADATISSYNPKPIFNQSSTWTAITQDNCAGNPSCNGSCQSGCIAQVGWISWFPCVYSNISWTTGCSGGTENSDGKEHIFVQWTADNSSYSNVYAYSTPSGNVQYSASRIYDHTTNGVRYYYFNFCWSGCVSSPAYYTWGANGIQNLEEVHDYSSTNYEGTAYGGDSSTHVSYTYMDWVDQNSMSHTPSQSRRTDGWGAFDSPLSNPVTTSMSVQDSRC
jgi:hypothetical protein